MSLHVDIEKTPHIPSRSLINVLSVITYLFILDLFLQVRYINTYSTLAILSSAGHF